mgnify:CR=1 FL=1
MKNLSTVSKLVIYSSVAGVAITLISLFTVFMGYPGWTIGIAIGSVIDTAVVALLYVGGDRTIQSRKIGVTIAFYILRIILLTAGLLVPALLEYKVNIEIMKYSTFGAAIGYIPGVFVVIMVLTKMKNEDYNK